MPKGWPRALIGALPERWFRVQKPLASGARQPLRSGPRWSRTDSPSGSPRRTATAGPCTTVAFRMPGSRALPRAIPLVGHEHADSRPRLAVYASTEKLAICARRPDANPALLPRRPLTRDAAFAAELPAYVAEVGSLFDPHVLREYLDSVRRVRAHGHVLVDEQFEGARSLFDEGAVEAAEDAVLMGRPEMLIE